MGLAVEDAQVDRQQHEHEQQEAQRRRASTRRTGRGGGQGSSRVLETASLSEAHALPLTRPPALDSVPPSLAGRLSLSSPGKATFPCHDGCRILNRALGLLAAGLRHGREPGPTRPRARRRARRRGSTRTPTSSASTRSPRQTGASSVPAVPADGTFGPPRASRSAAARARPTGAARPPTVRERVRALEERAAGLRTRIAERERAPGTTPSTGAAGARPRDRPRSRRCRRRSRPSSGACSRPRRTSRSGRAVTERCPVGCARKPRATPTAASSSPRPDRPGATGA